jgi:hypothetical protein
MKHLLLAVFILLSTGCIPYSDSALSDQSKESLDTSLIGTWFWNEESDQGFVHIGKDSNDKTLLITMVEFKNDGNVETTELRGFTTRLSSQRYLNLSWVRPKESETGYFFMKYNTSKNTLECSFPDIGFISDAVKSGVLKGKVLSPGELFPAIRINADQNDLRDFFLKNDAALFKNTSALKKLALPKPKSSQKQNKKAANQ